MAQRLVGDWLTEPRARRELVEFQRAVLGSVVARPDGSALRRAIEEALRSERVLAFARPRRRVVVPIETVEGVLPEDVAADQDDWIQVMLFDSAGDPIAHARFTVRLASGVALADKAIMDGFGRVPSIPPGGPTACSVEFPGIDEGEALNLEAPAAAPPKIDASLVRGVLDGPRALGRAELVKPQPANLDGTCVFQLERRRADVIELEHFSRGGAVFLPDLAPASVREDAPLVHGLEALRVVLERGRAAMGETLIVTGHDAQLSQERADGVALLLAGKKNEWASLAASVAKPEDRAAIRDWSPGSFPDDDAAWNEETWGAVFDRYAKELVPPPPPPPDGGDQPYLVVDNRHQTYPVKLAEISMHDANRYTDLNHYNPDMVLPNGGGWRAPKIGQKIFLPKDWNLKNLIDATYEVHVPEAPPPPAQPSAFLATTPPAIGCGPRHLEHPDQASAERRGTSRYVEAVFLGAGETPPTIAKSDSASDTKTDALYDPYAFDRDYVPLDAHKTFVAIHLRDQDGDPIGSRPYVVTLPDGKTIEGVLDAHGFARVDGLDPGSCIVTFPDLAEVVEEPGEEEKTKILVRVRDTEGELVPDANVHLLGPEKKTGVTQADGFARFESVVPGDYRVLVSHAGFMPGEADVLASGNLVVPRAPILRLGFMAGDPLQTNDGPNDGGLPPGGVDVQIKGIRVEVHVQDRANKGALGGARVRLGPNPEGADPGQFDESRTSDTGDAAVGAPKNDEDYMLLVEREGYLKTKFPIRLTAQPGKAAHFDVSMRKMPRKIWYVTLDSPKNSADSFPGWHGSNFTGLKAAVDAWNATSPRSGALDLEAPKWFKNIQDITTDEIRDEGVFALFLSGSFTEWHDQRDMADWAAMLVKWGNLMRITRQPTLAICGSHQMLNAAMTGWGTVGHMSSAGTPSPTIAAELAMKSGENIPSPRIGEVGSFSFRATAQGAADPLFRGLGNRVMWFTNSHFDQVLPSAMSSRFVPLVTSATDVAPKTIDTHPIAAQDRCPVQALKLTGSSRVLYSLQFHPELVIHPDFNNATKHPSGKLPPATDGKRLLTNFFDIAQGYWDGAIE